MSEECSSSCSSCGEGSCSSRTEPQSMIEKLNEHSSVKKVIGIVSGKGGVGKSLVTSMLAVAMQKQGNHAAILDADITGPSIPKAFGIVEKAVALESAILPGKSSTGIDIMSINLLMENETDPVIWRGPMIAGVVKQFWTDVIWENVDYMFVDMPPGTGDVPLTVFQSLPVDGIIVVTSPQDLVSMIVAKAVIMAQKMNIPVLGIVENMSYLECPDCGKKIEVFGKSKIEEVAENFGIEVIAKLPIDPSIASKCDAGRVEDTNVEMLEAIISKINTL